MFSILFYFNTSLEHLSSYKWIKNTLMKCYCGTDTSAKEDINGSLERRGETRCLEGVSVYWLVIQTCYAATQQTSNENDRSNAIIESLHEIT